MTVSRQDTDFERIQAALADADEPLTAREIRDLLEDRGLEFESAHQVATVLGRAAEAGAVEVIHSSPYRYRVAGTN